MNPAIVQDTVAAIIRQTKLEDRFHADLTKAFLAVYADGVAHASPIVKSVPLTDAEIDAFRASIRRSK